MDRRVGADLSATSPLAGARSHGIASPDALADVRGGLVGRLALQTLGRRLRSIAKLNHDVSGFCSQGLIRACVARGILTIPEADDVTVQLVGLNGDFVSLTGSEIARFAVRTGFQASQTLSKLMRQLEDCRYQDDTSPYVLGGVLATGWFEIDSSGPLRAEWADRCLDSLNAAASRIPALVRMLFGAGTQLVLFPESFSALMHFVARSEKLTGEEQRFVRDNMVALLAKLADAAQKVSNVNPRVAAKWERFTLDYHARRTLLG